jgi:CheY-like chemotaxis protein
MEFDVLAGHILGEAIEMELRLDPNAGACHVDPAQFGSALLNVVINARDAMAGRGRLTVVTGNVDLDERAASAHADARATGYVFVDIADTGTGMPPEVLERATEPFFTTKETGQGSGLGLSQVYGFVSQSQGFLTIESSPGNGTHVRIHLPRENAAGKSEQPPEAEATTKAHGATILIVEDDVDVRTLVVAQLEDLGYRTETATTAQEALDVVNSGRADIDLVFTDVVMPGGMSGVDLVRALREHRPALPVVLTSGFMASSGSGESSGESAEPSEPELSLLAKPYRQADLARTIEEVLNRRSAA